MVANVTTLPSLSMTRTFTAPRERVFQAWTDPEELKKWWGPGGYSTPTAEVDLKVGGSYRFGMKPPEGEVFFLSGEYREIRSPEKLVYTWRWEGSEDHPEETLVTVEFRDRGEITEVVVTHEKFRDEEQCHQHEVGWAGCLDRLPAVF